MALAQSTWPSKPVKIVVAGAPGSTTDFVARLFSDWLTQSLGQQVIVEAKPGANGVIATDMVAKSPKDGYTLLFTYAAAQVVNPYLIAKLPYDPVRDFSPVAQIGAGGNLLVVLPKFPAQNLREFIEYARQKPKDSLTYGSWGNGSGGHLSMEVINQQAGLSLRHVPYKSVAAATTDLLAGEIDVAFTAVTTALPLVRDGKLKPLALSAINRIPQLPDVATMSEQGIKFELTAWFGMLAPAGTPNDVVRRLNGEINRYLVDPTKADRLSQLGFGDLPVKSPDEFAQTVRSDLEEWGKIVKAANITAE